MRYVKFALLIFVFVSIACQASAPKNLQSAGWHEQSIQVGENLRWFQVYIPRNLQSETPVVVLLHGGTQSMRKIFRENAGGSKAWLDIAEQEGILLLVPNGANSDTGDTKGDRQNWNDLRPANSTRDSEFDDVGFISTLLDWAEKQYSIDSKRIYVTGASNGGMMTYRLLIETPERFAAAVAFISSLPGDPTLVKQPSAPTPLMIANGTLDPLVKWEGGEIRGRPGSQITSVEANLAWWIEANRAENEMAVTTLLPDTNPDDHCLIYETVYPASTNGAPVVFIKMDGGGHAMPSIKYQIPENVLIDQLIGNVCKDVEGAQLAWDFMKNYAR